MSKASAVVRRFCGRRAIAGVLAVLASAGTLGAVAASNASAAISWEAPITFECYNNGTIRADSVGDSLSAGQGNVVWGLYLLEYNARTRRWVHVYTSAMQHYDSDQMFEQLVPQAIDVNVARGHYYAAEDIIGNSTTPARYYRDHAEIGGVSEYICQP